MAKKRTSKGSFHYKRKFLYLGIKRIDKEISSVNLRDFIAILEKGGVKTGPVFGSLLGIVRDNDFITWDEDIDLYLLKEQEDAFDDLLPVLKAEGFELIRYERRGLYSFMRNGEYMDVYVLEDVGGGIRHTGSTFFFDKDFTDTVSLDFKGISVNIPKDIDRHLEFLYGDWKTPVQYADFELSTLSKLLLRMKVAFKNALPDCMYYPMLRRHHRKDFDAFVRKCEKKGIKLDLNKIRH
ncbi:MAG: LicD family protein [Muribaculaceae bacterium]|nr:LicD family protein [Muribaculaceae bacterium]